MTINRIGDNLARLMDGRDDDTMDKVVNGLMTASHGLPVTYAPVPFDTPMVCVYIHGDESIGSIMWATDDIDRKPETYTWWSVSTLAIECKNHGKDGLRRALAHLLNRYIDKRVGLV